MGETEAPASESDLPCPGCEAPLAVWSLDPHLSPDDSVYRGVDARIHGCRSCGGAWIDRHTLASMLAEAAARAPKYVDPKTVPKREMHGGTKVVYRKCASCQQLMNRRNFAWISGIIVDECPSCGTYFDAGELEGVIAFVRAGGLSLANDRGALERKSIKLSEFPLATQGSVLASRPIDYSAELALVVGFLRWAGRWLRRFAKRHLGERGG